MEKMSTILKQTTHVLSTSFVVLDATVSDGESFADDEALATFDDIFFSSE